MKSAGIVETKETLILSGPRLGDRRQDALRPDGPEHRHHNPPSRRRPPQGAKRPKVEIAKFPGYRTISSKSSPKNRNIAGLAPFFLAWPHFSWPRFSYTIIPVELGRHYDG